MDNSWASTGERRPTTPNRHLTTAARCLGAPAINPLKRHRPQHAIVSFARIVKLAGFFFISALRGPCSLAIGTADPRLELRRPVAKELVTPGIQRNYHDANRRHHAK